MMKALSILSIMGIVLSALGVISACFEHNFNAGIWAANSLIWASVSFINLRVNASKEALRILRDERGRP